MGQQSGMLRDKKLYIFYSVVVVMCLGGDTGQQVRFPHDFHPSDESEELGNKVVRGSCSTSL